MLTIIRQLMFHLDSQSVVGVEFGHNSQVLVRFHTIQGRSSEAGQLDTHSVGGLFRVTRHDVASDLTECARWFGVTVAPFYPRAAEWRKNFGF